jgi:cytosine/uracil/thiamine/allantoin permease
MCRKRLCIFTSIQRSLTPSSLLCSLFQCWLDQWSLHGKGEFLKAVKAFELWTAHFLPLSFLWLRIFVVKLLKTKAVKLQMETESPTDSEMVTHFAGLLHS